MLPSGSSPSGVGVSRRLVKYAQSAKLVDSGATVGGGAGAAVSTFRCVSNKLIFTFDGEQIVSTAGMGVFTIPAGATCLVDGYTLYLLLYANNVSQGSPAYIKDRYMSFFVQSTSADVDGEILLGGSVVPLDFSHGLKIEYAFNPGNIGPTDPALPVRYDLRGVIKAGDVDVTLTLYMRTRHWVPRMGATCLTQADTNTQTGVTLNNGGGGVS